MMEMNSRMPVTISEDFVSTETMTSSYELLNALSGILPLHISMMCVIGVIGLAGNGLTLVIFTRYKSLGKPWHLSMVKLQAAADLLCSLVLILQEGLACGLTNNFSNFSSIWTCKLVGSGLFYMVSNRWSVISLMALTINRYVHTIHPNSSLCNLSSWKKWLGISAAMGSNLVFSTYFSITLTDFKGHVCVPVTTDKTIALSFHIIDTLFLFCLPIFLFIFCYSNIFLALRKRQRAISTQPSIITTHQNMVPKRESNVAITMALVCLIFAICWTPVYTWLFIRISYPEMENYLTIALFLASINCCTNPIIYGFKYRGFWVRVKHFLCCKSINNVAPAEMALAHNQP